MTDKKADAWPRPECRLEMKETAESFRPCPSLVSAIKNVKAGLDTTQKMGRNLAGGIRDTLTDPSRAVEVPGRHGVADTAGVLARLVLLPQHPPNSFRGYLVVRKCAAWTEPISLGNIKTVGRIVEATLNDVLIATVTGALRRYLKKRNDKVNELELQVTVPVNIRKARDRI